MNYKEERPWGSFEILHEEDDLKIKKIIVKPQQRLSLQSHNHRCENWVIKSGEAEMTLDDKVFHLKKEDSVFIPVKSKHRIKNPGNELLVFIEVQLGDYLGEDDIIRYQDDYKRS